MSPSSSRSSRSSRKQSLLEAIEDAGALRRATAINRKRVYRLAEEDGHAGDGPVVYWMSREQRTADNWPLLYAQQEAVQRKVPLVVVFCLVTGFLDAPWRHYAFMLRGLRQVEQDLTEKAIPFHLLMGDPVERITQFVREYEAARLVTDFDPLKIKTRWRREVADAVSVPFDEVDGRNVIPCRTASDKQEYAAYTFRPKVKRQVGTFLEELPRLMRHPYHSADAAPASRVDWQQAEGFLRADRSIPPVEWIEPGERAARAVLDDFIQNRLPRYAAERNDPNAGVFSDLSPYLHFGQIASARVALEVFRCGASEENREAFLEELVVRRELSDNFCHHNSSYDSADCFPSWAQETLAEHRGDDRPHLYSFEELEQARTHDDLWNAAQLEMVCRGKMHGYMRMYWGKKILEWSRDPAEAMRSAIRLNDRYELDGRDPNGYAGIAWSMGGVHDRPWPERPIFGKIRYMSYNGCRSKFDVVAYIESIRNQVRSSGR